MISIQYVFVFSSRSYKCIDKKEIYKTKKRRKSALNSKTFLVLLQLLDKAHVGSTTRPGTLKLLQTLIECPSVLFHQIRNQNHRTPRNPCRTVDQNICFLSLLFDELESRPEHVTHFLILVVAQFKGDVGELWWILIAEIDS